MKPQMSAVLLGRNSCFLFCFAYASSSGNSDEKFEKMWTNAEIENSKLDNKSRSKIAYWLTIAFIALAAVIIVGAPVYNATIGKDSQIDIGKLLNGFGVLFGTAFGFVLGYYFKDKK